MILISVNLSKIGIVNSSIKCLLFLFTIGRQREKNILNIFNSLKEKMVLNLKGIYAVAFEFVMTFDCLTQISYYEIMEIIRFTFTL